MAYTLAEIAVRLVANTGEFISGFSSAGAATKRFRADLSEHIGAVGQVLEQGLSQFGEFGETIGRTLGSATSAASAAVLSFGRLGGSMGTVVGVGAGVAAGLLAAEAGIIGIALHAAEGAAKLGEMSEKAGVSTQTFAGLALAGKGVGVESETLVKALGFMGSNAVKAAIAADFSKTSFGRLGIQVKDTAGQMKDGGQLFLEVVGKISALPTSEQGFFVKQIFGRGGLEILPLINKGVDAISEKMELASKFGLGDPQTVAAARQFKETVDEIKAAFEGVALLLAKDLLPSLQVIAQEISAAFKGGGAKEFINDIAEVVKYTLAVGAAMIDLAKIAFELGQTLNPFSTSHFDKGVDAGAKIREAIKSGSGAQIKDALKEAAGFVFKPQLDFANTFKDVHDILDAKTPTIARKTSPFQPDLTPAKEDTTLARVKERIAALNQEQTDWANTAAAATEAETLISKAVQKGNEAFGKLKTEAARDKTGAAEKFVAQQEAQIKAAAASVFYDQTVVKTNEELDKQADQLTQTDKAALALGAAYKQGGEAIAGAALDKQFAKEAAAVAELSGVRNVAALTAKLERNETIARKVVSDELVASLTKESSELSTLAPFVDALSLAYLKNEDAVRAARIELEAQKFAQSELAKGVNVNTATVDVTGSNGVRETITLLEQKRRILTEADAEAYRGALAQEAAQFNISTQYDNQIVKLQRIKDLMQQQGVSTLGVEAQIFDEQNRLIHQWDEWAGKVGTFKQKFQSVMGELIIQGRNAGQAIRDSFVTAIDGIETNLAKLLTGGKADFKAVFQNLAESVTKAEIQKGVGKLAEHIPGIGNLLKGAGPLGSSASNPMFVAIVGAAPASVPFGKTNPFGGGFGVGSDANPDQHSGIGGFFSGIASLFGGFHASGGNIPAGRWGITGEQGPEIVQGPASVTPAGQTYNITHNHNYPTAESRDLFGRTQNQNQARQTRNMRMAYGY